MDHDVCAVGAREHAWSTLALEENSRTSPIPQSRRSGHDQSAPCRIRTCDRRIRSKILSVVECHLTVVRTAFVRIACQSVPGPDDA
jgi:hypothetical protein